MSGRGCLGGALVGAAVFVAHVHAAHAQTREPLCTTVESRRLVAGPSLSGAAGDRLVAQPLLVGGPAGERFVVAVRDPEHALGPEGGAAARPGGLAVLRLDTQLRRVGAPVFVEDPTPAAPASEGLVAALPVGVALAAGVLVLQVLAGDVYATLVPPAGAVAPPRRLVEAPAARAAGEQRGFTWLTATARGEGAIALAGTEPGEVYALRFDRAGTPIAAPALWGQRVGGPMQLLPTGPGPAAALLGRPVRGTGPQNEQARMQVLVQLNEALSPVGQVFATGFAQFPMAYALRGDSLVLLQWAQNQGLAISALPVAETRIGEQLPRVWYARPPLEGVHVGQAALVGPGNVVYDVATFSDPVGAAVYGHVAWVPPSAAPTVRRDVLPMRAVLVTPPQLLPAADGVVAVMATRDETGGAVDAYHVRCDLVAPTPPPAASDSTAR